MSRSVTVAENEILAGIRREFIPFHLQPLEKLLMIRTGLPTHAEYMRTRYFGALDGLRCLSIVWVIGFHDKLSNTALFRRGDYGVGLFFVISGFLITTLLLREKASRGEISLKNFYARRTLRIFPLYYAGILLYTALVVAVEHGPERAEYFRHLPFFLTYTGNWFVDRFAAERVIFAFSWSLATEEQFYLLWPSILRFTRGRHTPLICVISALAISTIAIGLDASDHLPFGSVGNRILTSIAPSICLGCVLAYVFDSRRAFEFVRPILGRLLSAPLAFLLVVMVYAGLMRVEAGSVAEHAIDALFTIVLVLLVAACCMREDNGASKVLSNRAVRYVGTISYGMYMLHMLGINATRKLLTAHDWRFFAVSLVMAIALASASFWLYERQFLKLKNRFANRVPNEPAKPEFEPASPGSASMSLAPSAGH